MRIIDTNTDFYDYYQNIYKDDSLVFDRTDSFVLRKEDVCSSLYSPTDVRKRRFSDSILHDSSFVLLQIGNAFWLFWVEITKVNDWNEPKDFSVELLAKWKDYNRKRELVQLCVIYFDFSINKLITSYENHKYNKTKVLNRIDDLIDSIKNNNYKISTMFNRYTISRGDGKEVEKHIPLLIASGLTTAIDPLEIYLAFEEYFSLEKTSNERTSSKDITDKERIESHGFDAKVSFRGKRKT